MANGELLFEAPWEGRVFGISRVLCESGLYEWDEFREHLIATIERWEATHGVGEAYHYYELFLCALTSLLEEKGICLEHELEQRAEAFASRPHGHDH